jgi:raffinose/stachyose/melibiose transport system substrate-binding protein
LIGIILGSSKTEKNKKRLTKMKLLKTSMAVAVAAATLVTSNLAFAEDTVLQLYTWREQDQAVFDYINENNLIPGVRIKSNVYNGAGEHETKLRIDFQTNRPDLYHAKAGTAWIQPWIDAGVAAPVTDLGINLENFGDAALFGATGVDGKVYGVPFVMQMQSILYNKAVVKSEPKNLQELEALFESLKGQGIVPLHVDGRDAWYLNQVLHETILAGMTDDKWSQDVVVGEACFTDDVYVDAMERFKSWQDKGYMNPTPLADDYGSMRTGVALGTSAMMIDGIWSATPSSPMYEIDPSLELGYMAIPGASNKVYGFVDGHIAYNPNSKNTAAIKKVLEFYTTKEFSQLFADKVEAIPASTHKINVEVERVNQAAKLIGTNALPGLPFFTPALNGGEPTYQALTAAGLQELLAGKSTAKEMAEKIQKTLNAQGYVGAKNCAM